MPLKKAMTLEMNFSYLRITPKKALQLGLVIKENSIRTETFFQQSRLQVGDLN